MSDRSCLVPASYEVHHFKDPLLPFIYHDRFALPAFHCPVNWHENVELLYCLQGHGQVHCGLEISEFSEGELCIVNPGLTHYITSDTALEYRCLIVDNDFFLQNGLPLRNRHFQSHIHDAQLASHFAAIAQAYTQQRNGLPLATAQIRSAVLCLLLYLCTAYSRPSAQAVPVGSIPIKKALDYLRGHALESVSLDEVAAHAGISKYYLSRQFSVYTGRTFIQTLQYIRCTEARRMLEMGTPVSEAAVTCGFENLSYFTRTFKKYIGCLPSQVARHSRSET